MRRSGKTSIQKVVFHKMSPHETLFLESTTKIIKTDISNSAFLQFEVWDFPPPGPTEFTEQASKWASVFAACSALVWVIDVQDDYSESISRLQAALVVAAHANPHLTAEVFVHKSDSFSEDQKFEAQRDVHEQLAQEMANSRLNVPLRVFLTSIYDQSVFEALSKVVQKLLPQLPTLQNLMDALLAKCAGEKAFLFDLVSKLYLATDSSPVDMQLYELCSDVIDVVIDVSYIYGPREANGSGMVTMPASVSGAKDAAGGAAGAPAGDGAEAEEWSGMPLADAAAQSSAVIRLSTGSVLHLRHVNRYTALVTIMSDRTLAKQGLVELNFQHFKEAVRLLFEPAQAGAQGEMTPGGSSAHQQQQLGATES
eukprot:CAMPEP_0185198018 /NCGR_PEP_ID=MMETSP1140-20130426/41828_1 /TAXON_ID=298111 /ORGANISM="Pavlova sp., Strain CCMP459" /LENGTH=367 /DNA_ID=CAMNT_0027765185 /DNA_START=31 /DNA_END=1134 /DNA_ORIENTATION=-